MSVIVQSYSDKSLKLFMKGSPEKMKELCIAESIPANFDETLSFYT